MTNNNQSLALFYPEGHEVHVEQGHLERPERIEAIRAALQQAGWWDEASLLLPLEVPPEVLTNVHTPDYLNLLEMACRRGGRLDADTYVTPASWKLVQRTAGGALSVARAVWRREARRGFALTRPPGHHACRGQGMGFCLLNNVALAAEYLIQVENTQRLAIVDLDLHHGNGTQDIFWRRGDVFYLSTHQSPFYPGSGALEDRGVGAGEGCTANFPLPPFSGDQAYRTVMAEFILPLLDRFEPEMVLVSYGFDPHWGEPLGNLLLSVDGYADLIASLAGWADARCQGRLALFLEGGYHLRVAEECTLAVLAALMGQQWEDSLGPAPYEEGSSWRVVMRAAKQLWELS